MGSASVSYYQMQRGWTDLALFQNEKFCSRAAWAWLVENAAWTETLIRIDHTPVSLDRGELSFSEHFMATKWRWSRSRVHRFLNELATWGMIRRRNSPTRKSDSSADRGQSIITICNYNENQDVGEIFEARDEQTLNRLRTDSEHKKKTDKTKEEAEANASVTRARQAEHDAFNRWWQVYPHKIGKAAAAKAFTKALAKTSLDTLLAAVECYKTTKPPDRSWCNPKTWLNESRWLDEPAPTLAIINGGLSNGPTRGQPGSFARAVEESRRAVFELNDRDRQRALATGDQGTDRFDFGWPDGRVR